MHCGDGASGADALCRVVNTANAPSNGTYFPASFVNGLPPPMNTLPSFSWVGPSVTPAATRLTSGEVAGIVVGVLLVTIVVVVVWRRVTKRRDQAPLLEQHDGDEPIRVSSRSASELESISGSKRRLFDNTTHDTHYASLN
jgi:hypothetical protein